MAWMDEMSLRITGDTGSKVMQYGRTPQRHSESDPVNCVSCAAAAFYTIGRPGVVCLVRTAPCVGFPCLLLLPKVEEQNYLPHAYSSLTAGWILVVSSFGASGQSKKKRAQDVLVF